MSDKFTTVSHKEFEVLVITHHKQLLAYALSMVSSYHLAEDLVQEAFVTAYTRMDSFDTNRSFSAWLRGIIRMKYLEWCRVQKDLPLGDDILDYLDSQHNHWDASSDGSDLLFLALKQCISALSSTFQRVVDLFYMQRQSGASVAAITCSSEVTVRKRLQRARVELGKCINKRISEESHD